MNTKTATRFDDRSATASRQSAPVLTPPEPSIVVGALTSTAVVASTKSSATRVSALSPNLEAAWQQFVQRSQESTLFHDLAWKQAVETCFPHRAHYLVADQGGDVSGILPLFEIRSYFAPKFLLSVPYATCGGIVADSNTAVTALINSARSIQGDIGAASIQLRSAHACLPDVPVERTHASFKGELPDDLRDVPGVFPRKARAAARQAAKRYPITVEAGPMTLPAVWSLYSRSMRRLGSPNYPFAFFEALQRGFGDRSLVQLLRVDGRPVAGLMSFVFKDSIVPYFVGVDERLKLYGLTHYLYQQCMLEGVRRGCRVFDFGRTRYGNKGPFDFKRHCGFEPTPLEYQTLVSTGGRRSDLSPASSRWQLARRIWRHLPLTVTRPVGAWAARSIPG